MRLLAFALLSGVCGLLLGGDGVMADSVRLQDDTTLQADVAQVDDDYVVLRVPRGGVKTIDGVALPPPLAEGMAAPAFSAVDKAGAVQTVGKGAVPLTVLHFWVSWCPYCRSDQPVIQQLSDRFRQDERVRVVTVSLDEKREALDAFLAQHHVSYPVIVAQDAVQQSGGADVAALYQIHGFPVTFLIDGQGVIRRKIGGSFVKGGMDLAALVDELLAPASKTP